MKISAIFLALILASPADSKVQISLNKKYPYNLLTDDYGTLKEDDLVYDINLSGLDPNDLKNPHLKFYRWQCFPINNVNYHYHTWKDLNPFGGADIIALCDFGIKVKLTDRSHFYYDRRARPIEFCQKMHKDWKRLATHQSHICLNGEPGSYENGEMGWIWNKAKTKNGCISLFKGDCDTKNSLKESR